MPEVRVDSSFKDAAKAWLAWSQSRNRKPIRETSVPSIESPLNKWLIPHLGHLPLSMVHSGSCQPLVKAMQKAKLTGKTQEIYMTIVKSVVASVVDPESGEPVYSRKWNAAMLDMDEVKDQKQPCLTKDEIEKMLVVDGWERLLYVLLATTGLRIGEALGLETKHVINGGRTLVIEQKVDRFGEISDVKTKAGRREVDLHPDVTDYLLTYIRGKKGLLFTSTKGTTLWAGNLEKRRLSKFTDKGWHSFRRFRITHLREQLCQHDIEIYWAGHKPQDMSELYSKLSRMLPARLKEAERCGVGFDVHVKTLFTRKGRKYFPTANFGK